MKHIFGRNISRIIASANELTIASREVAEGTMPHAYYQEIYGLVIASIIGHIVVCHWAFNKECDHGIPLYKCSLCQPNSVTTQTYDLRNPEEKDKWMKVTNEELQILVQKGAVVYDERQHKYFEPGSTREVEILNTEPKITVDRQEIGELATETVTLENMDLEPTAFEARLRIAEALIGSEWMVLTLKHIGEKFPSSPVKENYKTLATVTATLANDIVEGIDETCWEYEDEGDDTSTS